MLPSGDAKFSAASNKVVHHQDCKKQEIRLQMGSVTIDGTDRKALLVDSDAKTTKERSMYDRACQCYEEGLVWKFYNVIRTVEETFHTLKSDLDIRPVYHKSDEGIKAHLNLAVLAYWLVSVTKYRLKVKKYDNVRWDEIIRIASTQVLVTAELKAENGETIRVRQCTEAEEKLSDIYLK